MNHWECGRGERLRIWKGIPWPLSERSLLVKELGLNSIGRGDPAQGFKWASNRIGLEDGLYGEKTGDRKSQPVNLAVFERSYTIQQCHLCLLFFQHAKITLNNCFLLQMGHTFLCSFSCCFAEYSFFQAQSSDPSRILDLIIMKKIRLSEHSSLVKKNCMRLTYCLLSQQG